MSDGRSFSADLVQCTVYTWNCNRCHIYLEQGYDWPSCEPREWRIKWYSLNNSRLLTEEELLKELEKN